MWLDDDDYFLYLLYYFGLNDDMDDDSDDYYFEDVYDDYYYSSGEDCFGFVFVCNCVRIKSNESEMFLEIDFVLSYKVFFF